jgi:hypothetical protein
MNSLSIGDRVSFFYNGARYPGTVSHLFADLTIIQPAQPLDVRGVEVSMVEKASV